jgi:hypothetical protein
MFGFSGSVSDSNSEQQSDSQYSQDVWGGQGGALENMYGSMQDLWGQSMGNMGGYQQMAQGLQPYMQSIMSGGMGSYNNMNQGGSYGDTSDVRAKLMESMDQTSGGSQMGNMYDSIVGGSGNTYIDPMVDAMKQSGYETMDRMESQTGLDAGSMGQGGSNRHAMQNAMQNSKMKEGMDQQELNMRGGAYDTDLKMKMDIARQADAGIQSTQDRYMQMMSGSDMNRNQGMNQGQNMQNLGMGSMAPWQQAMMMPWQMMGMYNQGMGDPTVLESGDSSSSGSSDSSSKSVGFGM